MVERSGSAMVDRARIGPRGRPNRNPLDNKRQATADRNGPANRRARRIGRILHKLGGSEPFRRWCALDARCLNRRRKIPKVTSNRSEREEHCSRLHAFQDMLDLCQVRNTRKEPPPTPTYSPKWIPKRPIWIPIDPPASNAASLYPRNHDNSQWPDPSITWNHAEYPPLHRFRFLPFDARCGVHGPFRHRCD